MTKVMTIVKRLDHCRSSPAVDGSQEFHSASPAARIYQALRA
jgi:hypothetical protein